MLQRRRSTPLAGTFFRHLAQVPAVAPPDDPAGDHLRRCSRQHHGGAGLPQALAQGGGEDSHNEGDAQQLLRHLRPGGEAHRPPGHKVPLEAAHNGNHRQAQGQDAQGEGRPLIVNPQPGGQVRPKELEPRRQKPQDQGGQQQLFTEAPEPLAAPQGHFLGDHPGGGDADSRGGDGESKVINGGDKLIKPHPLGANLGRQVDPEHHADPPQGQGGPSENHGVF